VGKQNVEFIKIQGNGQSQKYDHSLIRCINQRNFDYTN